MKDLTEDEREKLKRQLLREHGIYMEKVWRDHYHKLSEDDQLEDLLSTCDMWWEPSGSMMR